MQNMPIPLGAGDRTRTGTLSPAVDFESSSPEFRRRRCSALYAANPDKSSVFEIFEKFSQKAISQKISVRKELGKNRGELKTICGVLPMTKELTQFKERTQHEKEQNVLSEAIQELS